MNVIRACQCVISLSLVGAAVPTHIQATTASGSDAATAAPNTPEATKAPTPGTANPSGTTRGVTPAGKLRQGPMPPDRAREVEERVRSGQMEQPIAQGEISERLNQLQSGSPHLADETATGSSSR